MTNNQTPNQANSYASAASAYGVRQEVNLSGFEVTFKLYEGMLRFIGQAKNAHGAGQFEEMVELIQKVNKILIALQSNLSFEDEGKEAAVFLNDLYMEVFKRLTFILRTDDPQTEFDKVRDLLQPVAKMWADHAENAKSTNPQSHISVPETPESLK